MKQETPEICIFHLKIDSEMKNELKRLDLFKQAGSISRLIVEILSILAPLVEKEHFFGEQRGSKYELIHSDPEIKRASTHVYMPDYLYRQLKLIHQDLNCYSIAGLVREFLRVFLELVERYGDNYQEELENIMGRCNADIEKSRFSHGVVLQLLQFIHQRVRVIRLFTIYSHKFVPRKIFFL